MSLFSVKFFRKGKNHYGNQNILVLSRTTITVYNNFSDIRRNIIINVRVQTLRNFLSTSLDDCLIPKITFSGIGYHMSYNVRIYKVNVNLGDSNLRFISVPGPMSTLAFLLIQAPDIIIEKMQADDSESEKRNIEQERMPFSRLLPSPTLPVQSSLYCKCFT
ncbi:hypothetical protein ABEB36_015196 [Hypothenemus hampei]|uniref:Uncharacterized protein n=1 Tax=Hypothenemus hampei TaxID=57062 RepID=A0ABD1E0N5_HYPHA